MWIFPQWIDRRTLRSRSGKSGIRVSGLCSGLLRNFGSPPITLPVQALGRRLFGHALPPDAAVGSERYIRKDRVPRERRHRIGIGLPRGAWRHSKKARFGIDGPQLTSLVGPNPGYVIANRPYFPSFEAFRRDQHREIGFSAGAGKCRGDVSLLSLRRLHAEDQHVLGHPAFVSRNCGCDTQSEALLSQQGVSPVSGTKRPDLAALGKMHDVLFFIAGP